MCRFPPEGRGEQGWEGPHRTAGARPLQRVGAAGPQRAAGGSDGGERGQVRVHRHPPVHAQKPAVHEREERTRLSTAPAGLR